MFKLNFSVTRAVVSQGNLKQNVLDIIIAAHTDNLITVEY